MATRLIGLANCFRQELCRFADQSVAELHGFDQAPLREVFLRVSESQVPVASKRGTWGSQSVQSRIMCSVAYFLCRSQQSISKIEAIKSSKARIQTSRWSHGLGGGAVVSEVD